MKKYIITIDTEGDNLWNYRDGMSITTENVAFIPRFQELCEKYGFKPTYLCNWEIINDDRFVKYAYRKLLDNKCEIGMHLHAWNTPPFFKLPSDESSGLPFLIEYDKEIMDKKIMSMTKAIIEKFDRRPLVHRAGRWAMNNQYFELLNKHGYIADCSVTPGVDWSSTRGQIPGFVGSDYSDYNTDSSLINGVVEVPVTIMSSHKLFNKAYKDKLNYEQRKRVLWLRPNGQNLEQMLYLISRRYNSKIDFLEFMIHSSELMPGGSPTFKKTEDIEKLYVHLDKIFRKISEKYEGVGLEEYARSFRGEKIDYVTD